MHNKVGLEGNHGCDRFHVELRVNLEIYVRRKIKEVMVLKTLLIILLLLGFCMPTVSYTETPPVVGTVTELIMEYGDISETKCATKYKR